ncbi:MAG: metal-sensing transcriptional repressor [Oscillospiraceae bacterium]|jgi:DNA-binding FrmR family transcriptional regulator|nr:metal-sensing transcriptional repressor [Oscillospiraceae bacterium]MCI1991300.1 metal-sensing transcriptional repressor [Oscillospiraceae bacterium]MCI2035285.1 metal-sensing transcriptional repressor [Oscillospiraceae bacterium]
MVADKGKVLRQLKTARGQLDGLIKMVEDDRYCIDISNQIMAAQAILRNVNREVLHAHLNCCVKEAFGTEDAQQKIDEIIGVMDKLSK